MRKALRRKPRQGAVAKGRAREDGDRHAREDRAPAPPARKLDEVVGTHQPYEALPRIEPLQCRDRIGGVARAEGGFERGDANARMPAIGARLLQTVAQRRHAGDGLERVLRRDQPPHLVEIEALQGFEADMAMAFMRRIEGPAEQADPPFRQMAEMQAPGAIEPASQGRT